MDQRHARLRVCASCEWIFKDHDSFTKCGFAHYGERHVYGDKCYKYKYSQEPWMNSKIRCYTSKLNSIIYETNQFKEKDKFCLINIAGWKN